MNKDAPIMKEHRMEPARELPRAVVGILSAAIAFHLFTLFIVVLAARSGMWSVGYLPVRTFSDPPMFAGLVNEYSTGMYLQPLGLANNYHFVTNMTDLPS